jgi:hypothetical protein
LDKVFEKSLKDWFGTGEQVWERAEQDAHKIKVASLGEELTIFRKKNLEGQGFPTLRKFARSKLED